MPYIRVRVVHTGLAGAPYLSTHYFDGGGALAAQEYITLVQSFWQAIGAQISVNNTMSVLGTVTVHDTATGNTTGELIGTQAQAAGSNINGAEWTAKQGIIAFNTSTFGDGRRLTARTFVPGPTAAAGEQAPTSNYRNVLDVAAGGLIENAVTEGTILVAVRRPRAATASLPARVGSIAPITSAVTRTYWGVLRSRRT